MFCSLFFLLRKAKGTVSYTTGPARHRTLSMLLDPANSHRAMSSWKSIMAILIFLIAGIGAALPALGQTTIRDDFNGTSLNSNLWTAMPYLSPETWSVDVNQRLELAVKSGEVVVGLNIPFKPGNLDVQVDFTLLDWVDQDGGDIIGGLAGGRISLVGEGDYAVLREDTNYIATFLPTAETTIPTPDQVGRLRLTWFGQTVSLYYWSGGAWQLLKQGNFPDRMDEPVRLSLFAAASPSQHCSIAFTNFIASGEPATDVLITDLIHDAMSLNAQSGISNSFDAKISAAMDTLDDSNTKNNVAAINEMNAFINAVVAQRGKKLTEADADRLIAKAQTIIVALGG